VVTLTYGQSCDACGHVFCPTKGQVLCLEKHACDNIGLHGPCFAFEYSPSLLPKRQNPSRSLKRSHKVIAR